MRVSDPLTIPVSAVTTLIDRQAIWDLTVEYAHAADLHDGEAVAAMFADDGVLSVRTGDGAVVDLVGRDDIASRLGALDRYRFTSHANANLVVSVDGDRAQGRSRCTAHHFGDVDGRWVDRVAYLRYIDDYVRSDGRWWFGHRIVHIDLEEQRPVELYHWPAEAPSIGSDGESNGSEGKAS